MLRKDDPYVDDVHLPWIGKDMPSLHPERKGFIGVDIPGYDLRTILLPEPLAVANAFFVQIRCVLATVSLMLSLSLLVALNINFSYFLTINEHGFKGLCCQRVML